MEITNTLDFTNYTISHDLPNDSSLVGIDIDYIQENDAEDFVEFEFDEATV